MNIAFEHWIQLFGICIRKFVNRGAGRAESASLTRVLLYLGANAEGIKSHG